MGSVKGEMIVNKNASAVLVKLLEGRMKISKLQDVVRNYSTLKLTLIELERSGYVRMEEKIEGRKVIYVELTPKGRAVAEKLLEASSVAKLSSREIEKFRDMRALMHLNVYEDHVSIMDIHMGEERIANIYPRRKGHEIYFWCDLHDDTDCYHIHYMFADPKLSEFIRSWIEENGYHLARKYQKYVDRYW